jgi:glycosyltransferase involved in cell wall biosynthesis
MRNNKLVSVIVPVFNVKPYLESCIDSILSQTYENIEIILVNDGSNDGSELICNKYSEFDDRIKLINKNNGGLSDARNTGIYAAKGDYICFIDSDDYVHPMFVELLLKDLLEKNSDISVCNFYRVDVKGAVEEDKKIKSALFNNIEAMRDILLPNSFCEVMTWNKIYKKEIFTANKIIFPLGKIHEDNFTTYKLMYHSNLISFINVPLYYYRQRQDSIMNQPFSPKRLDAIMATDDMYLWIKNNKIPLLKVAGANQLATRITILNSMFDNNAINNEIWNEVSEWIRNNNNILVSNRFIPKRHRQIIRYIGYGKLPYFLFRHLYKLSKDFRTSLKRNKKINHDDIKYSLAYEIYKGNDNDK